MLRMRKVQLVNWLFVRQKPSYIMPATTIHQEQQMVDAYRSLHMAWLYTAQHWTKMPTKQIVARHQTLPRKFNFLSFDIVKGGTQGFPRHEVSDKQEVLFEDVSPSTAFSIRQQF